MKKSETRTVFFVALGLSLCCLLAVVIVVGYVYLRPLWAPQPAVARALPSVLFSAPQSGDEVAVGELVPVHAVARGNTRIRRVELWIDGRLHAAQDSTLSGGSSPFPLVSYWEPVTPGPHTLMARAIDVEGTQARSSVDVMATGGDDRDGDGVPDAEDACPDQPGAPSAAGCPDGDGDGVPDSSDACPDVPGAGADGCPAPAGDDRDGDGVPDDEDACPDEPGLFGSGCPLIGDRDADGVPDPEDACPDVSGSPAAAGCPDRDGDGVPDDEDACPDEAGPFEGGCPAPSAGDRDGDGFPDDEDRCPDEPGVPETWGCPDRDRDGVPDSEDDCPDEWGLPVDSGCPAPEGAGPGDGVDSDGDGIPDLEDACPGAPGLPEHEGCPDSDGDGVPDYRDMCPDEPGLPENLGCPEGTADRDGDGVPDAVDPCPDEPGRPEDGGCPPPTEEDEPEGEVFGDIEGQDDRVLVEFQALSFQVGHDYDGVYCYPRLGIEPVERYSFEPSGEQQWDIATPLGSRRVLTDPERPIAVQVECGGDIVFAGTGGDPLSGHGWGVYWGLGEIDASHPPSDWDGHVITARSGGGDDGHWFEAQYRLCLGSCDETAFPPPLLTLSHGREDLLIWQWNGDMDQLAGYSVYVDGNRIMRMHGTSNVATMDVGGYAPLCGGLRGFYVVAYGADGRESPPSNVVTWAADACPRVVRITFEQLTTYDTGDEEDNCLGPIFGSFWVEGSESRSLRFEGDDYPNGFRLCPNQRYNIQEMFDTIWWWGSGMGSSPYSAPASSSVAVELGPDEDLTFGGVIYEWDRAGTQHVYREAFNRFLTRPANQVHPGRYALRSGEIRLEYTIDVLVGPEVGPEPDLSITNVDRHEPSGQLRVHVFNNAADMPAPADITVHWVRAGSSEIVGRQTWPDVQIPSGGSRILQSSEPLEEMGGMLFVLDPEEAIPDGNRSNNSFETPVTMRVEFLQVEAPNCSENCSIFNCSGEWVFMFWAGYGRTESDITWIAYHERFPPFGDLVACGSSVCDPRGSPDEDWIMEGDLRYSFNLEMPATENLYVMVTGTELDNIGRDDPFSSPVYSYTPRESWGARSDPYTGYLLATSECEAFCITCADTEVRARWRITRVQ